MSSSRVRQAIKDMDKRFANSAMTQETFLAYAEDLEDLAALDEDAVVNAIRELRMSSQFLPTIKDIREKTAELMDRDMWVLEAAAWGEVERECKRVGAHPLPRSYTDPATGEFVTVEAERPRFSSPIIATAVESIGWQDLCLSTGDQRNTLRAQLREAIKAIQNKLRYAIVSGRYVTQGDGQLRLPETTGGMRSIEAVVHEMIEARQRPAIAERGQDDAEQA